MCVFGLRVPGEEDVPAAVRPTVHLAGGGVAVRRETKGGATARTGHAAETGGTLYFEFFDALVVLVVNISCFIIAANHRTQIIVILLTQSC